MIKQTHILQAVVCLVLLLISGCATAQPCQTTNPALQLMKDGWVEVKRADGSRQAFKVKVADTNKMRAAGFQRVCEDTIAQTPILFVFSAPMRPRFHMNNVVAPIDIAFIREDSSIDSVQAMKPYVQVETRKPQYSPASSVIAALEGHKGFFSQHNIDTLATISWSFTKPISIEN